MKKTTSILILLLCTLLIGCNRSNQINASSNRTATRSITIIKNKLPLSQRIEFEVSYWSLRDEIKDNKAFLNEIDGLTPEGLIAKGKEIFEKRKTGGLKDYQQFDNWDQMIAQYTEERTDQNRRKRIDGRDGKYPHRVDYKMHSM